MLQLTGFIMLCEGFLGLMPNTDLWGKLFFLNQQGWRPSPCLTMGQP